MYKVYSTLNCVYCELARTALNEKNIEFEDIKLDTDEKKKFFKEQGFRTVPQIYDDEDNHIGGWDELKKKLY